MDQMSKSAFQEATKHYSGISTQCHIDCTCLIIIKVSFPKHLKRWHRIGVEDIFKRTFRKIDCR